MTLTKTKSVPKQIQEIVLFIMILSYISKTTFHHLFVNASLKSYRKSGWQLTKITRKLFFLHLLRIRMCEAFIQREGYNVIH